MLAIFLETLPFFALIGLGYAARRTAFFSEEATAYLTRFVFYFALSAMLLRFSATLDIGALFSWDFVWAYLSASALIYALVAGVALARGRPLEEAAFEGQCSVIGNVGFLGIPMLALLMGEAAVGPVMFVLSIDLIVFGSLVVAVVNGARDGRMSLGMLRSIGLGLLKNPMIMSITLGLLWARTGMAIPGPADQFLSILGAAATPGALFAIGASLASKSAERIEVASWLSFAKLVLHPAAIAVAVLFIFDVDNYAGAVMIACASLPVAGNIFILAQHYGVAPQRVSASILVSTVASVVTVSLVIGWLVQV
ncbi:malate transporter [Actibacterium mucosum KCTC 23349]|uniref:Malate transporter n=1 Tax=Actibacterium mucosum KCTC 23349 TaxID=1454373 RepID=A0A037ZKP6_9RHOB|nr:AEC family transporter [Actibacterium mucosum]KAJ57001.1 malate transporter [Actibacterium mucosum KCTC 23349]